MPHRSPRPRPRSRTAAMLAELLVVTLIVGVLASRICANLAELGTTPSEATRGICAANKRNLAAALEALAAATPGVRPPALPEGYGALRDAGLLREPPYEPGTRNWGVTYVTTPEGNIVCRAHDLHETPVGDGPVRRMLVLELLACGLVVGACVAWRYGHQLSPQYRLAHPEPRPGQRPSAYALDAATRVAVKGFLAELHRQATSPWEDDRPG